MTSRLSGMPQPEHVLRFRTVLAPVLAAVKQLDGSGGVTGTTQSGREELSRQLIPQGVTSPTHHSMPFTSKQTLVLHERITRVLQEFRLTRGPQRPSM